MFLEVKKITREQFVETLAESQNPEVDKFAKTFIAKADMGKYWQKELVMGAFDGANRLLGAVAMTLSNKGVANLQLLHTFARGRGLGVGRELMEWADHVASVSIFAKYFRVSSEPDSVGFYEKLGYKFWGKQKGGCSLCMFRYGESGEAIYDDTDPVIHQALYSGRKGSLASSYKTEKEESLFND